MRAFLESNEWRIGGVCWTISQTNSLGRQPTSYPFPFMHSPQALSYSARAFCFAWACCVSLSFSLTISFATAHRATSTANRRSNFCPFSGVPTNGSADGTQGRTFSCTSCGPPQEPPLVQRERWGNSPVGDPRLFARLPTCNKQIHPALAVPWIGPEREIPSIFRKPFQ